MEAFIIYMLKSAICLTIFGLVYYLFLRKTTFYNFNRFFLLSGLTLSFVLPFQVFTYDIMMESAPDISLMELGEVSATPIAEESFADIAWTIVGIIYVLGMSVIVARQLLTYFRIGKIRANSSCTNYKNISIYNEKTVKTPFSFLNGIYLNTNNISEKEKEIIIQHEKTHIEQKHWIDLLCSECALVLQWFNPLMWIFSSFLKENHEYLVDEVMLKSGVSLPMYKASLLNQKFQGPVFSFTNSFNYSNILNRFKMMKKTKSSPWMKAAALIVFPLMGIFYTATAKANYVADEPNTISEVVNDSIPKNTTIIKDGKIITRKEMDKLPADQIGNVTIYKKGANWDEVKKLYPDLNLDNSKSVIAIKTKNGDNKFPSNIEVFVDGKQINYAQMRNLSDKDALFINGSIRMIMASDSKKTKGNPSKISSDRITVLASDKKINDVVASLDESEYDPYKPFTMAEQMPRYTGGEDAMMKFILENLKYPQEYSKEKIQGRVTIRFVVAKDGKVTDARVIRGIHPEFDKEALRVINLMPNWVPGKQNGNVVPVYYTLPIIFRTEK